MRFLIGVQSAHIEVPLRSMPPRDGQIRLFPIATIELLLLVPILPYTTYFGGWIY